MKRTIILIMALAIVLSFFPNEASAEGQPTYLGEVCFYMSSGVLSIFDSTLKLGVLSFGENHFVLDGRIKGDLPSSAFVHGSGAMDGDKIVISLNSTDSTEIAGTPSTGYFTFYHIVLDATALIGNYTQMGFGITFATSPGSAEASAQPFIRTGSVHNTPCQ